MNHVLYYECHITIEPVIDDGNRFDKLQILCAKHGFKIADLFMVTGEPSRRDTFVSARNDSQSQLIQKMVDLLTALGANEFKVYRYKIEAALLDVRL